MKILLTGAAGNLGTQLLKQLAEDHDVIGADIVGDVSHVVDLTDYAATHQLARRIAPEIVLHPAAWTDVNGCALNPQKALLVNGIATAHLAAITAQLAIPLLYVSSNEVFDGTLDRPYTELDQPNPINPYGYSKWYGERAIVQINPKHYIVRSSWLFAHGGGNFVHAILNAADCRQALARRHQRSRQSDLHQ